MLTELCHELKNWFVKSDDDKHIGEFVISDGVITPSTVLQENQYYRIIGSLYNDGVHCNNANDVLIDESFDGAVWVMYVPNEVIALDKEISEWKSKYEDTINSPFQSESFGGYSYTKKSGSDSNKTVTWVDTFSDKMKRWRKL